MIEFTSRTKEEEDILTQQMIDFFASLNSSDINVDEWSGDEFNEDDDGENGETLESFGYDSGDSLLSKHYGGGHDQTKHGYRGAQRVSGLMDNSKVPDGEFKGSSRHIAPLRLIPEGGSFYDFIDFDDPTPPAQQLLEMALEYLPFAPHMNQETGKPVYTTKDFLEIEGLNIEDIDPELLAESLDAMLAVSEQFPGFTIAGLDYKMSVGEGTGGSFDMTTNRITINSRSIMLGAEGDAFISTWETQKRIGHAVQTDVSGTQKTVVHEFGHAVHTALKMHSLDSVIKIERATLKVIDPTFSEKIVASPAAKNYYDNPSWTQMMQTETPFGGGRNTKNSYLQDYTYGDSTVRGRVVDNDSTLYARQTIVEKAVSGYAAKCGLELWAELFGEVYTGGLTSGLRPAAQAFSDAMDKHWAAIVKSQQKYKR